MTTFQMYQMFRNQYKMNALRAWYAALMLSVCWVINEQVVQRIAETALAATVKWIRTNANTWKRLRDLPSPRSRNCG